jgi:hypothetical protein
MKSTKYFLLFNCGFCTNYFSSQPKYAKLIFTQRKEKSLIGKTRDRGEKMIGREPKLDNDVFFVCSLIEYIGRATKNRRSDVVSVLGRDTLARYLELADVYHCEPIENTASDLIEKYSIASGCFDNTVGISNVPTVFDIAKVYKRLIISVAENNGTMPVDALTDVYDSWISDKISDYECSMFYENPEYLYLSYVEGEPLKD